MRKINLIVIALMAVVIGFSSCNRGVTEPDKIGRQAFDILKNFDSNGRQGFEKNFPTIHDLRDLGRNDKVTTDIEIRNVLTSTPENEWLEQISENYADIKKMGNKHGINWKNIEYSDFIYEMEYEGGGLKYVEGELVIKHRGETYKIETYSMWNGKKYMILGIREYY